VGYDIYIISMDRGRHDERVEGGTKNNYEKECVRGRSKESGNSESWLSEEVQALVVRWISICHKFGILLHKLLKGFP